MSIIHSSHISGVRLLSEAKLPIQLDYARVVMWAYFLLKLNPKCCIVILFLIDTWWYWFRLLINGLWCCKASIEPSEQKKTRISLQSNNTNLQQSCLPAAVPSEWALFLIDKMNLSSRPRSIMISKTQPVARSSNDFRMCSYTILH